MLGETGSWMVLRTLHKGRQNGEKAVGTGSEPTGGLMAPGPQVHASASSSTATTSQSHSLCPRPPCTNSKTLVTVVQLRLPAPQKTLMKTLEEEENTSTEAPGGPPRGSAFNFSSFQGCEQDWNLIPGSFKSLLKHWPEEKQKNTQKNPKPYPFLLWVSSRTAKAFQIFQKCAKTSKKENKKNKRAKKRNVCQM